MASPAPADGFCDLVRKGGITSGVVYPPASAKLAEQYHFKNIDGTSAGAIAATLTAAAEYRRRRTGSVKGFTLVGRLPSTLGITNRAKNTPLRRLLQLDPSCRRLLQVLIGSLNAPTTAHRIRAILHGCISQYWPALVGSKVVNGRFLVYDTVHLAADGTLAVGWDSLRCGVQFLFNKCDPLVIDEGKFTFPPIMGMSMSIGARARAHFR